MKPFQQLRDCLHTGNLAIVFKHLYEKDFRLLHIGAHEGQESSMYKKYGIDDVYWVEPQATAVETMQSHFDPSRIIPFAVWSSQKKLSLNISENEVSSSVFPVLAHNPFNIGKSKSSQEVQAETIDFIISNYLPNDEKPLLIILDIQGSELEALKGLNLSAHREVIGLVVEVSKKPIYLGGATYQSIHSHLIQSGFGKAFGFVNPPTYHGDELFLSLSKESEIHINLRTLLIRCLIAVMLRYYMIKESWKKFSKFYSHRRKTIGLK